MIQIHHLSIPSQFPDPTSTARSFWSENQLIFTVMYLEHSVADFMILRITTCWLDPTRTPVIHTSTYLCWRGMCILYYQTEYKGHTSVYTLNSTNDPHQGARQKATSTRRVVTRDLRINQFWEQETACLWQRMLDWLSGCAIGAFPCFGLDSAVFPGHRGYLLLYPEKLKGFLCAVFWPFYGVIGPRREASRRCYASKWPCCICNSEKGCTDVYHTSWKWQYDVSSSCGEVWMINLLNTERFECCICLYQFANT